MDTKPILEILRFVSRTDFSEVIIEEGNLKLTIRRGVTGVNVPAVPAPVGPPLAPVAAPPPQAEPPQPPPAPAKPVEYIRSPMVGTFYRRPSPDKEPYVKVGDIIQKGQVVCIIEAMKLFNEIQSEISGRIVKILVEDGQAVSYDQPLFEVEPLE
ncbi:MAG: acetyl-CoA carboxylase biotin carboxyl carrier protein [Bacteroidia bacterium]|nr:acetyl-CoA carboxylase biotin carboxyl carrier protein [Bacteroidia bacterium]MDW8089018.1 acetyl-CoA carboxylase biotin carboxyl carrier protein [Bacteroidia bacterium]